jgi:AcrR family transcriptional regulator
MDELAAEAGLTKPALYKYFGDRSGLAAALGERFAARLVAGVLTAPADLALRSDPAAVLRDACDSFTAFIEADPHIYRFLIQHARSAPGRPQLLVDLAAHITKQLRELLVALGADPGPAPVWSYALIGSVFSAAEWWIESRAVSREQFVEWIAELTWRGLSGALAPIATS